MASVSSPAVSVAAPAKKAKALKPGEKTPEAIIAEIEDLATSMKTMTTANLNTDYAGHTITQVSAAQLKLLHGATIESVILNSDKTAAIACVSIEGKALNSDVALVDAGETIAGDITKKVAPGRIWTNALTGKYVPTLDKTIAEFVAKDPSITFVFSGELKKDASVSPKNKHLTVGSVVHCASFNKTTHTYKYFGKLTLLHTVNAEINVDGATVTLPLFYFGEKK